MIIDDMIFHMERIEEDAEKIAVDVRELSARVSLLQSECTNDELREAISETNQGTAGVIDLLMLTRDRAKQTRFMLEIMRSNKLII